jgi:integrase
LRMSELLALRWEDVDFEQGYLYVRHSYVEGDEGPPKNGKVRSVAMGDTVIGALAGHRHARSALVFCREDGSHLSKNQARRAIQRACKKAGIDPTSWHPLRHTYASHLGMLNAPFKAIQDFMGHSSADMTAHYMHLDPKVGREVAKLLDLSGSQVDIALTRGTN